MGDLVTLGARASTAMVLTQSVEIYSHWRQEHFDFALSISWPGHQQTWYWPSPSRFTPMEGKNIPIPLSQYHGSCWVTWRYQEPGHQQPWYLPSPAWLLQPHHQHPLYVGGIIIHHYLTETELTFCGAKQKLSIFHRLPKSPTTLSPTSGHQHPLHSCNWVHVLLLIPNLPTRGATGIGFRHSGSPPWLASDAMAAVIQWRWA